jgi:hypothetical protein
MPTEPVGKGYVEIGASLDKLKKDLAAAKALTKEALVSMGKDATDALGTALGGGGKPSRAMEAGTRDFRTAGKDLVGAMQKVLDQVGVKLPSFASQFGKLGAVTAGVGVVGGIATAGFKYYTELSDAMSALAIQTGVSGQNFGELRTEVLSTFQAMYQLSKMTITEGVNMGILAAQMKGAGYSASQLMTAATVLGQTAPEKTSPMDAMSLLRQVPFGGTLEKLGVFTGPGALPGNVMDAAMERARKLMPAALLKAGLPPEIAERMKAIVPNLLTVGATQMYSELFSLFGAPEFDAAMEELSKSAGAVEGTPFTSYKGPSSLMLPKKTKGTGGSSGRLGDYLLGPTTKSEPWGAMDLFLYEMGPTAPTPKRKSGKSITKMGLVPFGPEPSEHERWKAKTEDQDYDYLLKHGEARLQQIFDRFTDQDPSFDVGLGRASDLQGKEAFQNVRDIKLEQDAAYQRQLVKALYINSQATNRLSENMR